MAKNLPTKFLQLLGAVFCFLLLVGAFSTGADAQQANRKTTFTFSGPVEIPGLNGPITLAPGTYVFKVLEVIGTRNIVQVFNEDESHLYATILAITDYRPNPTGETIITFEERPANRPLAIKSWFYPGETYGRMFVYPKSEAVEIAKAAGEPVLSMPEEEAANITEPVTSAEEPAVAALAKAPVEAEEPSGKEVALGEVVRTRSTGPLVAQSLPRTASEMPLAALGGILLIGIGIGLGLLSRKFA
ncbi:MAG TPA: hypothetical protein VNJ52_02950 [Patescibacteria group bacterium]|nr:hypothetical protein [Patescibacteria group bacterium]